MSQKSRKSHENIYQRRITYAIISTRLRRNKQKCTSLFISSPQSLRHTQIGPSEEFQHIFSSNAKSTNAGAFQKAESYCSTTFFRISSIIQLWRKYTLSSVVPEKIRLHCKRIFSVIFALRRVLLAPPVIFASECYWASPSLLANIISLLRSRNITAKQYHSGVSRNITKPPPSAPTLDSCRYNRLTASSIGSASDIGLRQCYCLRAVGANIISLLHQQKYH